MNRPETKSLLIKGGHLIDPAAKINAPMDIILRDGRVAEVALPNKTRGGADEKIDARGLIVAPGFIDLHVHLREPGQSYKETIACGYRSSGGRRLHFGLHHAKYGARGRHGGVGAVATEAGARGRGQRVSHRGSYSR